MNASTKVVFNTTILYAKMMITMFISLYSVRLVLNALGASDYGIYNLIAGVIAMLSFLNVAMTIATQRYLSFHQGTKDIEMQKKIFINSWVLHILIGLIIVGLLLLLVPFLFDGFLNVPLDRIPVAKKIYYFMSISVFFTVISIPFTASLNAHENMMWIAIVNIIESVLKLAIAFFLLWFAQTERLVAYGVLMAGLHIVTFLLYAGFCLKKYNECSIKNYQIDKSLLKELSSFAGWNLFGSLSVLGRTQGLAIILNVFFGTIVNAAYGIAYQISAQVSFFSMTLLRALNPQIMKSEGMNDRKRMLRLSMMASKFGFFLLAFIAIPCIFEMPAILKIWLKNVPEYTVVFCSLILIGILINQLTIGLQAAAQSTGKIRNYQLGVSCILLSNLPIAFLLLKNGFPAYSVLLSYICLELFADVFRLFYLKRLAGLSIREYFNRVFLKELLPISVIILLCWIITSTINFQFRFLLTFTVPVLLFAVSIYFTGLCKDEKAIIDEMIFKKILSFKFKKKNKYVL